MRYPRPCLLLTAILAAAGCSRTPTERATIINGPDYRPRAAVTAVIDVPADDIRRVALRDPVLQLRDVEGGRLRVAPQMPLRAAFAGAGTVLFIDPVFPEVFMASADGVRTVLPAEPTRGFELRAPAAVLHLQDNRWLIGDRSTKMKLMALEDGRLAPLRTFDVVDVNDACLLGDRLVVRGTMDGDYPLHQYDVASGRKVRQFGESLHHRVRFVRQLMVDGIIGCGRGDAASQDVIVTMGYGFPFIYGYSPDGELRWVTQIRGLTPKPQAFVVRSDGPISLRQESADFDMPTRLLPLDGDRLLFQFARIRGEGRKTPEVAVHSVVLSQSTGAGAYVGAHLPSVIGGAWPTVITQNPGNRDEVFVGVLEAPRR